MTSLRLTTGTQACASFKCSKPLMNPSPRRARWSTAVQRPIIVQQPPSLRLFVRKETWTLSFPAKLLILAIGFPLEVYPYLAPTDPVHNGTMIIEGWISTGFLSQAAAAFDAGRYDR